MVCIGNNNSDVIKDVFDLNVAVQSIPNGLSLKEFDNLVDDNPAMIVFEQKDFWINDTLNGSHGGSYYNGTLNEPFVPRERASYEDARGSPVTNNTTFDDNLGGYYYEVTD